MFSLMLIITIITNYTSTSLLSIIHLTWSCFCFYLDLSSSSKEARWLSLARLKKSRRTFCAENEWRVGECAPYLCWIESVSDGEKLQQNHRQDTAPLFSSCNRRCGATLSAFIPLLPVFISFQISLLLPSLSLSSSLSLSHCISSCYPPSLALSFSCSLLPLLPLFSPYLSLYGKAVTSLPLLLHRPSLLSLYLSPL